jgi:hypothetical protein
MTLHGHCLLSKFGFQIFDQVWLLIAYTELILSINVRTSNGKVAFNLVKGCKKKTLQVNAAMA